MVRVHLNGDGCTRLFRLIQTCISSELLDNPILDEALKDIEHIYKREGLALYSTDFGIKSPESLSNGMKALILFATYDKHGILISSACCGANAAKYIPALSKQFDFDMALDYFLDLPEDSEIDAVDVDTGVHLHTGYEFKKYYSGKAGVY